MVFFSFRSIFHDALEVMFAVLANFASYDPNSGFAIKHVKVNFFANWLGIDWANQFILLLIFGYKIFDWHTIHEQIIT